MKYRFSGFEVNLELRVLLRNGRRVPLQPQPFQVLVMLLEAGGKVVSREAITQALWGSTHLASRDHSLNIAVRKLRDALDDLREEPRFVETVVRLGYRFLGEVEAVAVKLADPVPPVAIPVHLPQRRSDQRQLWPVLLLSLLVTTLSASVWVVLRKERPVEVRARLLWDGAKDVGGKVSRDGRYFPFTDWSSSDVGLGLRDLVEGQSRKLTHFEDWEKTQSEVGESVVSPDGKRVAFAWHHYEKNRLDAWSELMVMEVDGSGVRTLYREKGMSYIAPCSWTDDGQWIVAGVVIRDAGNDDGIDEIRLVSPETGQVRALRVRGSLWPYNAELSPDGQWLAYSVKPNRGKPVLRIRQIEGSEELELQNEAMMMGWTPEGKGLLFSRERGETHDLYHLPLAEGAVAGEAVAVHTASDVGTQPAGITDEGTMVYSTYNRRAETVVMRWTPGGLTGGGEVMKIPTTVGISWLLGPGAAHFSPDGKTVVVVNPANGFTMRSIDSGAERSIVPHMKGWRAVRWANDGASLLVLGTGRDGVSGIYRVDDKTGNAVRMVEVPPDTWSFTPSRDGLTLFFGTPMKTQAVEVKTGKRRVLFESLNGGNYDLRVSPDGKRLGIRGGKYLAVVDLASGAARKIYQTKEASPTALWGMDWTADSRTIVANVRPGTGTGLMELWVFSPETGLVEKRQQPASLRGISIQPAGEFVTSTRMSERWQVWSLENFLPVRP